jgi:lipopolysaccharide export system permease protein
MLKTIDRYVIREVVPPFVLSLLIFTFVLELPPLMGELERLLAKGVPWPTVGRIILLLSPQALGLTIPMALLVGLLIGLGRLSTDREAVALLACGVSPYRLLRPVGVLAGLATAATLYVMIEAIPDANQKYRKILFATLTKKMESDIQPRVFFQEFPNWVLYPRNEAEPGQPGWADVMLADTSKHEAVEIHMARRGRIVLDSVKRTVEVVLNDGTKYGTTGPGQSSATRFEQVIIRLDPDSVFPPLGVDLARGLTEKTIAHLQADIKEKTGRNESPHNEIMAIHAKFSIPMACLVFALIALALGLRVSRDGKLGGFVVGIGVIFAYYIAMFLAESAAKGHRIPPEYARWVPNLILGPFGIIAIFWRARHAEGRLPFGLRAPQIRLPAFLRRRTAPAPTRPGPDALGQSAHARSHAEPDRPLYQPALCARGGSVVPGAPRALLHLHVHRPIRQGVQGTGDDGHDRAPAGASDTAVHLLRHPDRGAAERARDLRPPGAKQRTDRDEGLRNQPVPHSALGRGSLARLQRRALLVGAAADGQRESAGRSAGRKDSWAAAENLESAQSSMGGWPGQRHLLLRELRPGAK